MHWHVLEAGALITGEVMRVDTTPTLRELADRWQGDRCQGCGGQIRDRWTLHLADRGACPVLVPRGSVTPPTGLAVENRPMTFTARCPALSWPLTGVNHRGSVAVAGGASGHPDGGHADALSRASSFVARLSQRLRASG